MGRTFHLSEIESYGYCPARYYYERKLNRDSDAKVVFDHVRGIFREFFRLQQLTRKNYNKLDKMVFDYQNLPGLVKDNVSPGLRVAYMQKSFELLWMSMAEKDTAVEVPRPLKLKLTDYYSVAIDIDAIFIIRGNKSYTRSKGTPVKLNYRNTTLRFCVLVPEAEWHPISLSNRADAMLCKQLIYPELKDPKHKTTFEMMYFCPDNGRCFTVRGRDITATSKTKARILDIIKRIGNHTFYPQPEGIRCTACPVISSCSPLNLYDTRGSHVSEVLQPPLTSES